ncbi:DUF6204 family protein [Streptomyces tendae]|uniref:DUF6204 family protein n=1 Tax=Streptomyces tendae TaxID=1932 RepID=UPI0036931B92
MSTHTFRITVRGVFDGLSTDQRAELLARAAHPLPGRQRSWIAPGRGAFSP